MFVFTVATPRDRRWGADSLGRPFHRETEAWRDDGVIFSIFLHEIKSIWSYHSIVGIPTILLLITLILLQCSRKLRTQARHQCWISLGATTSLLLLLLGRLPSALLLLLALAIEGKPRPCSTLTLLLVWRSRLLLLLLLLSTRPIERIALALRRWRGRSLVPVISLLLISLSGLIPIALLVGRGRRRRRRRPSLMAPLRHLRTLGVVSLLLLLLLLWPPRCIAVAGMKLSSVWLLLILLLRSVPSLWLLTWRAAAIVTLALGRRFHRAPCPCSGLIHLSTPTGALCQFSFIRADVHATISSLVAVVAAAQVGYGAPTERKLGTTNDLVLRLENWSRRDSPRKDNRHMRFLCGLIEGDTERQILFKIVGKECVMTFPSDFARRLRRTYRCAFIGGMQLVTKRLANTSGEFWALAAGNGIERLERFTIDLVLEDACRRLGQRMRSMNEDVSVIETASIAKLFLWCPLLLGWIPDK